MCWLFQIQLRADVMYNFLRSYSPIQSLKPPIRKGEPFFSFWEKCQQFHFAASYQVETVVPAAVWAPPPAANDFYLSTLSCRSFPHCRKNTSTVLHLRTVQIGDTGDFLRYSSPCIEISRSANIQITINVWCNLLEFSASVGLQAGIVSTEDSWRGGKGRGRREEKIYDRGGEEEGERRKLLN